MEIITDDLKDFKIKSKPDARNDYWTVECEVIIKNVETGEVRFFKDDLICVEEVWTGNYESGNYACDCNRSLFFDRAIGTEKENYECGDAKFLVNIINPLTGNYQYVEFEELN